MIQYLCNKNKLIGRDYLMSKNIIAVYGTLRNGKDSIDHIKGTMLHCGHFPSIKHHKDGELVEIEIKHVTEEQLKYYDQYEGLDSGLYKRVKVTTENGLKVWLYEGDLTYDEKRYPKIEADDDGVVRWKGGSVFNKQAPICILCEQDIVAGEYYNVQGGGSVHKECYDNYMKEYEEKKHEEDKSN